MPYRFPCAPVFQPCFLPAHPIWKWGAGSTRTWRPLWLIFRTSIPD